MEGHRLTWLVVSDLRPFAEEASSSMLVRTTKDRILADYATSSGSEGLPRRATVMSA